MLFKPKPIIRRLPYISAEEFTEYASPTAEAELTNGDPGIIEWSEIPTEVSKLVQEFSISRCFFSEEVYAVWGLKDLYDRLTDAKVYEIPYNPLRFDCDDFALKARAELSPFFPIPCFGIIWLIHPYGMCHAMNFCLASTKEGVRPFLYEPQLNTFYSNAEVKWKFYMMVI
jgi:hypothetical protein